MSQEQPVLRQPMPAEPIRISLTDSENPVELKLLLDTSRFTNGSMLMRLADTHISVSTGEGEQKRPAGSLGMAMGGALYVEVDDGSGSARLWQIDTAKLFAAVHQADAEWHKVYPRPTPTEITPETESPQTHE
jgi:hypothetical protein